MLRLSLFALYIAIFAKLHLAAVAQDGQADIGPQPTSGIIERVMLYRDQALVTRVVPIPAGLAEREILVGRLPERVVVDSVYAEGSEAIEVRGVRVTQQAAAESDQIEVRELTASRDALAKDRESLQQKIALIAKQTSYIDQLMSFTAVTSHADLNRGVLNASTLTELAEYSISKQTTLSADLQNQKAELASILEREGLVQQKLALLIQPSGRQYQAKVLVAVPADVAGTIELSYLVGGCGWSPQYTLRGAVGQEKFELRYNALVEQMSGENWNQVHLTLSTASPSMSASGPALTPFRVEAVSAANGGYGGDIFGGAGGMGGAGYGGEGAGYGGQGASTVDPFGGPAGQAGIQQQSQQLRQQKQAVENEFAGKHSNMDNLRRDNALNSVATQVQNMELLADSKQLKTLAADANDEVASQTYVLDQPVSLDSRREQQLVRIIDAQLAGKLYHVATPLLSSFAYREADMVNAGTVGLLRGPATIYLDDRFVGRAEIPSIASGQHLVVGFGADQQIRTRRELLEKSDEVQGGNRRLTFKYRLVIANFKDRSVTLRLYDRLPLAGQSAEVSVKPLDFQFPISEDGLYARMQKPRGVLRWDLEVPGERFGETSYDVEYSFSVEFDRNRRLSASADQEQIEADILELSAPSAGGMGGYGGSVPPPIP